MSNAVLECRALEKTFKEGPLKVDVLHGVDLAIAQGERDAIVDAHHPTGQNFSNGGGWESKCQQ